MNGAQQDTGQSHRAELAALQPHWVVARGGPPGLAAEDREALAAGRAPPSYLEVGRRMYASFGSFAAVIRYGGGALLVAAAGMAAIALLRDNGQWLGGALFCGVFGVFGLVMGSVWRRTAARARTGGDVPVGAVTGTVQRKWWRGGGPQRYGIGYVQLEQAVLGVPNNRLWKALRESVRYRFWYVPMTHDRDGEVLWIDIDPS